MPRPAMPTVPCDMVTDCPRAWVEFVATVNGRHVDSKRSCRQHATVAIAYMQTIRNAKVEVRIAR